MPERATAASRSEKSAEAVVAAGWAKGRTSRRAEGRVARTQCIKPASAGATREGEVKPSLK